MASMKDAYLHSPNHTALLYLGGQRVLMGYPNGSLFMALLPDYKILYKLSKPEAKRHGNKDDWKSMQ